MGQPKPAAGGSRPAVSPALFPKSAVVIGASSRTAAGIVENFSGKGIPVAAVHPRERSVGGLECFPSVAEVPFRPELALMLVGHARLERAVAQALEVGIRAFVVPGLGNEAGAAGGAVANAVASLMREAGASMVGPNCMGVAVPEGASFWIGTVPPTFLPGHVSAVVQSGSIGEALLAAGPRIGFRCVVSSGGEAVTDVADFCDFFAEDAGTRAIGLFLESVRRPQAFAASLGRLAEAGKPVACLKVGRSQGGARAVLAHSGALVGSDQAFSAMLRGHGVIEARDYPELVEVLEVLGRRRWPSGRRIGVVTNSGGEGALLADQAEAAGIPFPPLSATLSARLCAAFPNYLAPQNPVDAWAIDDVEKVFPGTFEILARSGEFDVLVAQVDQSRFLGKPETANAALITRALADAAAGAGMFAAVASVQPNDPPPAVVDVALERDVALLRGSANAMRALSAVAGWVPRRPVTVDVRPPAGLDDLLRPGALPELESGMVLERHGVEVAPRRRAVGGEAAAAAAAELGFPVVVKRDGPAHKSREGGVILGLSDAGSVSRAAQALGGRVLVARQVQAGIEAFCGMTRDPDYGPVLTVGLGGPAVEQLPGSVSCVAPVDLAEARRMAAEVPMLAGSNMVEGIGGVLVALGELAVRHPEIVAVDVNPVVVHEGRAIALDALVVVAGESQGESR